MFGTLQGELAASMEIGGHRRPAAVSKDKFVRRKFGRVARLIWDKPDAVIAAIAKCDARTGRRILRGEVEIPLCVMLAAVAEMVRPL